MMIAGKQVLPDTPQAKFWTWAISLCAGTLMGWLFLDAHFLRAAEGAEMKRDYTAQIAASNATQAAQTAEIRLQIEYSADLNAKRQIDNELYRLRQIPVQQLRPQDVAFKAKLETDREDLMRAWLQRGRPLR